MLASSFAASLKVVSGGASRVTANINSAVETAAMQIRTNANTNNSQTTPLRQRAGWMGGTGDVKNYDNVSTPTGSAGGRAAEAAGGRGERVSLDRIPPQVPLQYFSSSGSPVKPGAAREKVGQQQQCFSSIGDEEMGGNRGRPLAEMKEEGDNEDEEEGSHNLANKSATKEKEKNTDGLETAGFWNVGLRGMFSNNSSNFSAAPSPDVPSAPSLSSGAAEVSSTPTAHSYDTREAGEAGEAAGEGGGRAGRTLVRKPTG